jgi:hypothetical protein
MTQTSGMSMQAKQPQAKVPAKVPTCPCPDRPLLLPGPVHLLHPAVPKHPQHNKPFPPSPPNVTTQLHRSAEDCAHLYVP